MSGEDLKKIFRKTNLGENEVVCDVCGQLVKKDEVIEIRSPTSTWILHQHKDDAKCRRVRK